MRNKKFIAEHRGGLLSKAQHIQLIRWACTCTENVLHLSYSGRDERILNALPAARAWAEGKVRTGAAQKASREAHAAAREFNDPVAIAIARSAGHAVATAHMADHSIGAAMYALKAAKYAGISPMVLRKWQNEQLPEEIKIMTVREREAKEKHFKL